MTGASIIERIEASPDWASVPAWLAKAAIREARGAAGEDGRWIGLAEAAAIMDRRPSTLRGLCSTWARMGCPPVAVRKKGSAAGSPWLLWEPDCWAYRRGAGGGPRPVQGNSGAPLEGEVDEREATLQMWEHRVTANL